MLPARRRVRRAGGQPGAVPSASSGTARPSGSVDRSAGCRRPATSATQLWPVPSVPCSGAVRAPSSGPAQSAAAGRALPVRHAVLPGPQGRPSRSCVAGERPRAGHGSWAGPVAVAAGTGPSGVGSSRRAGPSTPPRPHATITAAATSHRAACWPSPHRRLRRPSSQPRRHRRGRPPATWLAQPRTAACCDADAARSPPSRCQPAPSAAAAGAQRQRRAGSTGTRRRPPSPSAAPAAFAGAVATGLRRRSATRLAGGTATGLHGCTATGLGGCTADRPSQRPRRPPPRTWRCRPSRTRRPSAMAAAGRARAGRWRRQRLTADVRARDGAGGRRGMRARARCARPRGGCPSESRSVGTAVAAAARPAAAVATGQVAADAAASTAHLRVPAWSPRRRPTGRLGCPAGRAARAGRSRPTPAEAPDDRRAGRGGRATATPLGASRTAGPGRRLDSRARFSRPDRPAAPSPSSRPDGRRVGAAKVIGSRRAVPAAPIPPRGPASR